MFSKPSRNRLVLRALPLALCASLVACNSSDPADDTTEVTSPTLIGHAVLPAATFAAGPVSGRYLGGTLFNGEPAPFASQPVQGFSAVLDAGGGAYWAMTDNGYGSIDNSADFNLRVYKVKPDFGGGKVEVQSFIELRDPNHKIDFPIVNHFSTARVLTGADFDIESMQRAADGTLWFGDEFGPYLLHTDAEGVLLEAPIPLPDFATPGREVRSPQNPRQEEIAALRVMNAVRQHAFDHGATRSPVFSPYHVELKYDVNGVRSDADAHYARGSHSPADLPRAASDIHDLVTLKKAGFPVVTWTVNDKARMTELMKAGVSGIISDRPDLLLSAVREFDANGDGVAGDLLDADGLIDPARFDAQGHRGGRNLRPENTLPAMEVALDNLMTTLELDTGLSSDGQLILKHDPYIEAQKCRRADGNPYAFADEQLIHAMTRAQIQSTFICDKVFRGPEQLNDPALSPVASQLAATKGYGHVYVPPTLNDVFDLVTAYVTYYSSGAGKTHPQAALRVKNAQRVRFNIETKLNPRSDADSHGKVYRDRTAGPDAMADAVANAIVAAHLEARADIQSFDFRTLLRVQEKHPAIRTVYLFGDFPIYSGPDSDDGTNEQGEAGANTPWMAGLYWPYRQTSLTLPFRAKRSGGFEGMAISPDRSKLYPLLELPLAGEDDKTLLISEFDLAKRSYTGRQFKYRLDARGTNIGDFILFNQDEGIVIERDGSQGDPAGHKKLYRIRLGNAGDYVAKSELVDLMQLANPDLVGGAGAPGDVAMGRPFGMPFTTIEDVLVLDDQTLLVMDDNNYPFSVGRHKGSGKPDDNEFIKIRLPQKLPLAR
ncbi:esterase-like activity of phytase family protein [Chitinibacteraceae bacterium HSL-7]